MRDEFEKYFNSNQKFPEELIKKWMFQILDGLNSLHSRKFIHIDIKLSNIMFDKNENIKIIDFGTSKYTLKKTLSNTLKGTPMFIAPEILLQDQNQKIDGKVDIYSLGIILFLLCFKQVAINSFLICTTIY